MSDTDTTPATAAVGLTTELAAELRRITLYCRDADEQCRVPLLPVTVLAMLDETDRLRALNLELAARLAAASECLSRAAERVHPAVAAVVPCLRCECGHTYGQQCLEACRDAVAQAAGVEVAGKRK